MPDLKERPLYWLTPVASFNQKTAEEIVNELVGKGNVFAFGDRAPGRILMEPLDWICFYVSRKGIVGHARIASRAIARQDSH
jgi:hypothetical protein